MRIAMVVTAQTRGGVYTNVKELVGGLTQVGDDVVLFVDEVLRDDFRNDLRDLANVEIHGLDQAAREHCDIWHLHLHDSFNRRALQLQLKRVLFKGRRSILIDEHLPRTPRSDSALDYEPDTPPGSKKPFAKQLKGIIKRLQYLLSGSVVVHSKASADFLSARYGTNVHRMILVPLGVPATPELEPKAASSTLQILLLAVVCFRKGHDLLIEATRFATKRWEVTFVGGGSQLDAFKELAKARGQQPIVFLGQANEPGDAIAACDVLCVPSRSDASSISALEAMMAGKPVVVSRADGVPELVHDGVTGLVVDAEDPRALAEALDKMAEETFRLQMGKEARKVMLATRTTGHMIRATRDAYKAMMFNG